MSLSVTIPDPLAGELREKALAIGKTPEEVALAAIVRSLSAPEDIDEALSPIRRAFEDSGLSEDDAVELFEEEKHALRRDRRNGSK